MYRTFPVCILTICAVASFLPAQEPATRPAAGAQAKAAEASMPEMPKPGPEHQGLAKAAGSWNVAIESPGQPTAKGTSQMQMTMNGFWLVEQFRCDWNGMPFEGHSTTGFDPKTGKYTSTWIDSASPTMTITTGTFDEKSRTLTMTGDGFDMAGNPVKVRTLTIHKSHDEVVFEMYQTAKGQPEAKVMTITYRRAEKESRRGDKER